jgi:hypothetical protein
MGASAPSDRVLNKLDAAGFALLVKLDSHEVYAPPG